MNILDQLIIINGKDRTDSIHSFQFHGDKCDIVFNNSSQVYSYNQSCIQVFKLKQTINPHQILFKYKETILSDIEKINDYGEFYKITCSGKKEFLCKKDEVQISKNCLTNKQNRELFQYFKEIANSTSLKTENGMNILKLQYDRIKKIDDSTILSHYFNPDWPIEKRKSIKPLIFPFGLNQSQKKAVENAFSSQISIIQGPPGTGKTQTILNIIANAVWNEKTVAVVSNNNSATQNVVDKMGKNELSFITAFLGSLKNKEAFLNSQTGEYPNMQKWKLNKNQVDMLDKDVSLLLQELDEFLNYKNRIAEINQEFISIDPEYYYFKKYYTNQEISIKSNKLSKYSSKKLLSLWLEYEFNANKKISLIKKLLLIIQFGKDVLSLFSYSPEQAIPFIQNLYYKNKIAELNEEKKLLEIKLKDYHFDTKMKELTEKSMKLFKAELTNHYLKKKNRIIFSKQDFRNKSKIFNNEYPVILSTTYSIKGTLSTDYIYDYLIIDEASQVDLVTGVLAFSCAKNIIIVGDQQQLPNVLTQTDIQVSNRIWNTFNLDERYNFTNHSLLDSALQIWPNAPTIILREHYRCHPKIANFFNQKFYKGQLIIMTEDHKAENVLSIYRTTPGNHARGHINQRQIDVIQQEILPKLKENGFSDIGIITPYRDQVSEIYNQFGDTYEIATVHKFQGREKEAIILASVDNIIGEFVDNPNLLNVAVSRAIKSLTVVISSNKENEKTNFGDLVKYIEYNNLQIVESKIYSVFDLLYKSYSQQRITYLKQHKKISEYDSENIAYVVIEKILSSDEFSQIDCAIHSSLATLIQDYSSFTEEEMKYGSNPLTHLDFLLFNKMDKKPILAIEIDGTHFHEKGTRQAERDILKNSILQKCGLPLLRIKTTESNIENRIITKLKEAIQ